MEDLNKNKFKPGDLIVTYDLSKENYYKKCGIAVYNSIKQIPHVVPQIPSIDDLSVPDKPMLVLEIVEEKNFFHLKVLGVNCVSGWITVEIPQSKEFGLMKWIP